MSIFERLELNVFQRLEEGLPLPDEMTLGEIVTLWAKSTDKSKTAYDIEQSCGLRVRVMREAFKSGSLQGVDVAAREEAEIAADETRGPLGLIPFEDSNRLRIMRECNVHIIIRKSDFIAWLEREKTPMPVNCQLEKWGLHTLHDAADGLLVRGQTASDEYKAKLVVQDIGRRYMEKYKDQPDVLNCTQAKKLAELEPYVNKYTKSKGAKYCGDNPDYVNKEGVKIDTWLWDTGLKPGKGRPEKLLKEFTPTLD